MDLELVIATDVSRSIDVDEAKLQREGIAAALRNPAVLEAIQGGYRKRIAVAYIDYSNAWETFVVVGWRIIDDAASAEAFAKQLSTAELNFGSRTSISDAIQFAAKLIDENEYDGLRRVIDVSGDGPNNHGLLVTAARDMANARGITINGLPIVDRGGGFGSQFSLPDLDDYYRGCVIGGPGAFLVVAENFRDFARAIRRKLVVEISGISPPGPDFAERTGLVRVNSSGGGYEYAGGCDIGERMWRQRWGNFGPGDN